MNHSKCCLLLEGTPPEEPLQWAGPGLQQLPDQARGSTHTGQVQQRLLHAALQPTSVTKYIVTQPHAERRSQCVSVSTSGEGKASVNKHWPTFAVVHLLQSAEQSALLQLC